MIEERIFENTDLEVRANEDGTEVIVGRGIPYNQWSQTMGGWFREIIEPGAADHLLEGDIYASVNHDDNQILGRRSNGLLKLTTSVAGVDYEVNPPEGLRYAEDLKINVKARNIVGSSFRFQVDTENGGEEEWDTSKEIYERRIKKFSALVEMGPVVNPAYRGRATKIAKRDFAYFRNLEEQEQQEQERDKIKNQSELELIQAAIVITKNQII